MREFQPAGFGRSRPVQVRRSGEATRCKSLHERAVFAHRKPVVRGKTGVIAGVMDNRERRHFYGCAFASFFGATDFQANAMAWPTVSASA